MTPPSAPNIPARGTRPPKAPATRSSCRCLPNVGEPLTCPVAHAPHPPSPIRTASGLGLRASRGALPLRRKCDSACSFHCMESGHSLCHLFGPRAVCPLYIYVICDMCVYINTYIHLRRRVCVCVWCVCVCCVRGVCVECGQIKHVAECRNAFLKTCARA